MSARVPAFVEARRSIRAFTEERVPHDMLEAMVLAACAAPAPHHSRPWRWVTIDTAAAKHALASAMGERWRVDLERDGVDRDRIDELVDASHRKITGAPAVVLGCLTHDGLDSYPDEARRRAEHGMALLSLGAAVENLMLTAADLGYATCWVAAPIFCPDAARAGVGLPDDWQPQAMVLVGRPDPAYVARPRPPVPLAELHRHL